MQGALSAPGTDEKDLSEAKEKMPSIENNNLFKIGKEGGIEHSFDIQFSSKEVDDSKPLVCVIPSLSAKGMTVSVSVNGQKKQMNSDSLSLYSKYFNLLYELPAGTRDIAVKFEGNPVPSLLSRIFRSGSSIMDIVSPRKISSRKTTRASSPDCKRKHCFLMP